MEPNLTLDKKLTKLYVVDENGERTELKGLVQGFEPVFEIGERVPDDDPIWPKTPVTYTFDIDPEVFNRTIRQLRAIMKRTNKKLEMGRHHVRKFKRLMSTVPPQHSRLGHKRRRNKRR